MLLPGIGSKRSNDWVLKDGGCLTKKKLKRYAMRWIVAQKHKA
jgi:hypothetical protein